MAKTADRPHLIFKYRHNVNIFLGDGRTYIIPHSMKEVPTSHGPCLQPVFDLDFEHKVELADERVMVPKKPPAMSERRYQDIVDAAYEKAHKASETNALIRKSIQDYVDNGDIEIVSDPFALNTEEDLIELAEDEKLPEEKTPVKQPVKK